MLYLISTPIGNLSDLTYRAVEILRGCQYILCEDTRHSRILLNHYQIDRPLRSFHKFNELSREEEILSDLKNGAQLALISDAGTPGISDPGTLLVQACVRENLTVLPIPGPSAVIAALSCSGLNTDRFQFVGFLPKKATELRRFLEEILDYPGTTIAYESPNRLEKALLSLQALAPERQLVVARELTKKFEEFLRGTAQDLLNHWKTRGKGELVLLISGKLPEEADWSSLDPEKHVAVLQEIHDISRQEAIKLAAKMRGVSKREIYNLFINKS